MSKVQDPPPVPAHIQHPKRKIQDTLPIPTKDEPMDRNPIYLFNKYLRLDWAIHRPCLHDLLRFLSLECMETRTKNAQSLLLQISVKPQPHYEKLTVRFSKRFTVFLNNDGGSQQNVLPQLMFYLNSRNLSNRATTLIRFLNKSKNPSGEVRMLFIR